MKGIFLSTLMLFFSAASAENQTKLYASYDGDITASIAVLPTTDSDQFLIEFEGFNHEYNNHVFRYQRMPTGSSGEGQVYEMMGVGEVNFRNEGKRALFAGSSVQYQEVYLHGLPPVRMLYQGEVAPLHQDRIRQQYQDQQGFKKSRVKSKKALDSAVKSIQSACSPSIAIVVDWAKFDSIDEKTTPAMGALYLESLEAICLIDDDYKDAVGTISKIEFVPETNSETSHAELENGLLTIPLHKNAPNVSRSSYRILFELLD